MTRTLCLRALVGLVLLGASPIAWSAQTGTLWRRGILSAHACALSRERDPQEGASQDPFLVKRPLNQTAPPFPWVSGPASVPDYSLQALFGGHAHASQFQLEEVDLDAVSSGTDFIPFINPDGSIVFGGPTWLGLAFSVSGDTAGAGGSVVAAVAADRDPGADLFTYYFEGSSGIEPGLVDRVLVEQAREDLGFPSGGAEDVDGFDFAMGVFRETPQLASTLLFVPTNQLYFSLSRQSAGSLGSTPFALDGTGTWQPAHAAAVYRMDWFPSLQTWGPPTVAWTPQSFGPLDAPEDIDGIAVSPAGQILFSTEIRDGQSQVQALLPGGPVDLRTPSGALVAGKMGVSGDSDNVDGLCGLDPESGTWGQEVGVPAHEAPHQADVGISLTRAQADGGEVIAMQATFTPPIDVIPQPILGFWETQRQGQAVVQTAVVISSSDPVAELTVPAGPPLHLMSARFVRIHPITGAPESSAWSLIRL